MSKRSLAPASPVLRSFFRSKLRVFVVLSALLTAGCDYPIASDQDVDVCALTLDAVATALTDVPISHSRSGACVFDTAEMSDVRGSIQISLLTRASVGGTGKLEQMFRIASAEAENAYAHAGVHGFAGLPEGVVAIAFGSHPPDHLRQVMVTERGVLMDISISGELVFSRDELAALTRELWGDVVSYKLASGSKE